MVQPPRDSRVSPDTPDRLLSQCYDTDASDPQLNREKQVYGTTTKTTGDRMFSKRRRLRRFPEPAPLTGTRKRPRAMAAGSFVPAYLSRKKKKKRGPVFFGCDDRAPNRYFARQQCGKLKPAGSDSDDGTAPWADEFFFCRVPAFSICRPRGRGRALPIYCSARLDLSAALKLTHNGSRIRAPGKCRHHPARDAVG